MNILNIPEFNIIQTHDTDNQYQIIVEAATQPIVCPHCGGVEAFHKHTKKEQLCNDLPMHGKQVGLYIQRQRYKCTGCNRTFWERLDSIDDTRFCTKRLVQYIEKQSLKRTFVSISEEIGVDEKTIRNIFRNYVNRLEAKIRFETPKWLGIDEIHIIKPRCVITNIEERTIVDILTDRNKATVISYLQHLPNRKYIQYVTMDMWQPYKDAVRAVLPQAQVIVDKFHVVRMANQALEIVRKDLRSSLPPKVRRTLMHDRFILLKRKHDLTPMEQVTLETWIGNFASLGTAYELKEGFYNIWESKSKQEAWETYQAWAEQIPEDLEYAFHDILTAVPNWQNEIFAYFDHPITNAYTESLNSLIRVMNRLGRGYSFDALRAKILFTEGVQKQKKATFRRQKLNQDVLYDRPFGVGNVIAESTMEYEQKNYGVDINTLVQKLENGELE